MECIVLGTCCVIPTESTDSVYAVGCLEESTVMSPDVLLLTLAHARRVIVCLSVGLCVCPRFFSAALAAMIVKYGRCSNHCLPSVQQES